MANRPVFKIKLSSPFFEEANVSFQYYSGFADSQRKKSAASLHEEFIRLNPDAKVLEVSRFSDSVLGQKLSAFNLLTELEDGSKVPVENAFQSSKVFAGEVQYLQLLHVHPAKAKKDERLKTSGALKCFRFQGEKFPLEPKTFFYDWIYINALVKNPSVSDELLKYNAFTDIVFNPEKSINCQARTVAIFVSLQNAGKLELALSNKEAFLQTVYGEGVEEVPVENYQFSLFC